MRFRRLTIEDGLSQSTVEAIVQDHSGMIWIGTEDGLNRYDGYEFTVFRNDPGNPSSISSSNTWGLHVDRRGHLWIGTYSSGLNRLDLATGTFTRFRHDPDDPGSISHDRVRSITEDSDGILWIATRGGGLNRFDPGTGKFTAYLHDPDSNNSLPSDNLRHVLPDSGGVLWVATSRGFSRFETYTGRFTNYRAGKPGSNSLVHDNVRHLIKDGDGALWISTVGGISRFDPVSGEFTGFLNGGRDQNGPGTVNIRRIFEDRNGRLLVGTVNEGLLVLDRTTGLFTSYMNDPADPMSLSNDGIRTIVEDRSGLLWIGTLGGGLNIHDPRTGRFRHYRHDPSDPNSLSDRIVWSIAQGPCGDIWFGTNKGDLNRYRKDKDLFELIEGVPVNSQDGRSRYIRSLLWDGEERLWLTGAFVGLHIYDPSDGSCQRLLHSPDDPGSISDDRIRSFFRDSSGDIWICQTYNGLDHYDAATGTFTNFSHDPGDPSSLSSDETISIAEDGEGAYWLATKDGLNRIEFSRGANGVSITSLDRFFHDPADTSSLSNNYILTVHESRAGDIWVGTMQGLSRLRKADRAEPVFTRYLIKDGLPNDVIYGILEDSRGHLWLSTNFGISCLDPETEIFRNFDSRDGLHGNEFNTGTFCRTREGTFIFGGVGGATEFHPDSLMKSHFDAPIVLTGFGIFDKQADLERPVSSMEEIVLSHSENYFSFEFASLDYSKPDANRYSYILEGLDRDWTDAGTRRFAGYTHVDPGRYTFRVRGTNGDGAWSSREASIIIVITPPFWRTWWFIALAALAASGIVAWIIINRVRQLLAVERLRSRIAADLHDDIGAGLTEISIMGEIVIRKLPSESKDLVASEIDRIGTTSRHLVESMSDIVWLVNPRRDSLFDLISRLGDSYKETLHSCGIVLRIEDLEHLGKVRLGMEYRQNLYLLFKEAINNALKYSGCCEISLSVEVHGRKLAMRLTDDGKGFDAEEAVEGNGLKNMRERAGRIGGSLTIDSSREKGTVITFDGPLH